MKRSTSNAQRSTPKAKTDPFRGVEFIQACLAEFYSEAEQTERDSLSVREGGPNRFDLEDRLLRLASAIIDLSEQLPQTRAGSHVAGQILRSGTAPYPNHGEAEAAESRDDFIHKLGICLKELRETRRWSRLIAFRNWCSGSPHLRHVIDESDELVRIFHASIRTAKNNTPRKPRGGPPH